MKKIIWKIYYALCITLLIPALALLLLDECLHAEFSMYLGYVFQGLAALTILLLLAERLSRK